MEYLSKIASLLTIICSFSASFQSLAQSDDEAALLKEINSYRKSNGLSVLSWDTNMHKMAHHHAKYLSIINAHPYGKSTLTHTEEIDIEGFEELKTIDDRAYKFTGKKYFFCAENAAFVNINGRSSPDSISQTAIRMWLKSEGHKKNLMLKEASLVSFSVQHFDMEINYKSGYDGTPKKTTLKVAIIVMVIH
jgi:uncharacterized protein YkwD